MYVKKFFSLPLLLFSLSTLVYADPYRVLSITTNASKEQIKRACKNKLFEAHPDKGGKTEDFIRVSEACEQLQGKKTRKLEDECTPATFFKPCSCPPNKTGFCGTSFRDGDFHFYCRCEESPFDQKYTQDSFDKEDTTQEDDPKFNTFEESFSRFDKEETFSQKNGRKFKTFEEFSHSFNYNFGWNDSFTDTRYEGSFYFLSRTVQSPVFSLPIEESLRPSPLEEGDAPYTSELALAPFAHFEKTDFFDGFYSQHEEGLLVRGGARLLGVDLDYIFSFSRKRDHFSRSPIDKEPFTFIAIDKTHVELSDLLYGVGRTLGTSFGWVGLKGLFGFSGLHRNLITKDSFLSVPHLNAGLRADVVFPFTFNSQSTHTVHTALRWLHFFGTNVSLKDATIRHIADFKAEPGDYIDLLFTFDTLFDSCRKHHLAFSYNPTFIIRDQIQPATIETKKALIHIHDLSLSKVLHTIAFTYTYDSSIFDKPFSFTVGCEGRFASSDASKTRHQNFSAFWASFSLAL